MDLEPSFERADLNRGLLNLCEQRREQASNDFETALKLAPALRGFLEERKAEIERRESCDLEDMPASELPNP